MFLSAVSRVFVSAEQRGRTARLMISDLGTEQHSLPMREVVLAGKEGERKEQDVLLDPIWVVIQTGCCRMMQMRSIQKLESRITDFGIIAHGSTTR
jgi:hypothetical protein